MKYLRIILCISAFLFCFKQVQAESVWQKYEDKNKLFSISFPDTWQRLNEGELSQGIIFGISVKNAEFCRIYVGSAYINEKPAGVVNLKDWAELHMQEGVKRGFREQFVKSYNSPYEAGVYSRATKDIEGEKDEFVQDQYMFSNFIDNKDDRRMWTVLVQFADRTTPEAIKKEIKEIIDSFDILSYKW